VAALDLGERYTGVALSDPDGVLASPLEVIPSELLEGYLHKLAEGGVAEVVVGVPKTLGGEVGFQAAKVLYKLRNLRETLPHVRFVEWDERFTTRAARAGTGGGTPGGKSGKVRRRGGPGKAGKRGGSAEGRVDHLAAAVMLQE